MLANKRCSRDPEGSLHENKRARPLLSGDLYWYVNKGVWSGLGEKLALKLSKSVVSIALSDGHKVKFSFSGIAIESLAHGYRFLTSASLVRALEEHDNLKIEVRHDGNVFIGILEKYDFDYEIAVVRITSPLNVRSVFLYNLAHYTPYCDVVSLGRDISGKLFAITGKLTPESSKSEDSEYLMFSSCKLSEVWEGGPLFDFAGDFVGMNLVPSMKKSFFLPVRLISEQLQLFKSSQQRTVFLERVDKLMPKRVRERLTDIPCSRPKVHSVAPNNSVAPNKDYQYLEVLGYPRPTGSDMILVNTFEEPFGDTYGHGVWKQLPKETCQKILRTVVSLASYEGGKRFFACSGTFIDWDGNQDNECQTILTSGCLVSNPDYPYDGGNMVVEGLKIQVLLPGKKPRKYREGKLMHYSLHYNVALVSVKTSCAISLPVLRHGSENLCFKLVAAVGRFFKSGDLKASVGKLYPHWSGPFDFQRLLYSTCKIKKVGIGGPLVDAEGNYIGMNFYDRKVGNPALFCDDIVDILDRFKKGTAAELDNDCQISWPVPSPKWLHPGDRNGITDSEAKTLASGLPYNYLCGDICLLK